MSQANLQAFALEKGITKALDKMSQGEMVMLRYQYLMQATADAQGDFARTSDGYANAIRLLQSNIQSIQTQLGNLFLPILADATTGINNFLSAITKEKPRTIFDDFAEINLKTEEKLAQIQGAADKASDLVGTLEGISSTVINYGQSGNLVKFIESLSGNVSGLDSAMDKAKQGDLNGALDELAQHLAQDLGGDPDKWKNLLQAVGNNAGLAIEATKGNTGKTKEFLEQVAAGADDLTTDYSTYWSNLLGALGDNAGDAIAALANGTNAGNIIAQIAGGANELKEGTSGKWASFARALGILDEHGNVPQTVGQLAKALAENLGGDPVKWGTMLQAIGNNLPNVTTAVGNDGDKTSAWLTAAAQAADDLGGDYSENWKKLLVVYGDHAAAAISALATTNDPGGVLSGMATGANKLLSSSPRVWNSLLDALTQVNGLSNIFNNTNAGKNVEDLATALSGNSPDTTKAEAWKTFLSALSEHPDALTTLTQTNAEDTAGWLSTMAQAVNEIEPGDADAWSKLFANFVQGLPGLNDTEGGHAFFQSIAQEFLAMGSQSEAARAGLELLGLSSEQIDTAQKQWLATCKQLVQTIPSLADVIDIETGEVKGGTEAITKHYEAWRKEQEKQLLWEAHYAKERALNEKRAQEYSYQLDYWNAEAEYKRKAQRYNDLGGDEAFRREVRFDSELNPYSRSEEGKALIEAEKDRFDAETKLQDAYKNLTREQEANSAATQELAKEKEVLTEKVGALEEQTKDATGATDDNTGSLIKNKDEVLKSIDATEKALKALQDYTDQVYKSSLRSVEGTLGGFNRILTPMDEAKQKVQDLTKQLNEFNGTGEEKSRLNILLADANNAIPTIQNLSEALDTQIKFLDDYYKSLDTMRKLGYSEDVIAMVSGGTAQDAANAMALADTRRGDANIKKINDQVESIKTKSKNLASAMTENKLAIDEEYKDLTQGVADAIAGLDQYDEAKKNINNTMKGILDGLGDNAKEVQAQVQNILDMLAQLSGASYNVNIPGFSMNIGTNGPVNPFLNINTNVNLNGKQVGSAVSQFQADQLNQMQRSGSNP